MKIGYITLMCSRSGTYYAKKKKKKVKLDDQDGSFGNPHAGWKKQSSCQKTPGISQFCSVTPTTVDQPQSAAASQTLGSASAWSSNMAASTPADIRATLGSTTTLRAEVLWCLHTITKHQSCNANEAVRDIFQTKFPDSAIACTFACGKDKTTDKTSK